jgi:hypothetical protein
MGEFFVKDPKDSSANSPNVPYCNYFLQQLILANFSDLERIAKYSSL